MNVTPDVLLPPNFQIQCLSLTQPWVSLVGIKLIMTRGWRTHYYGPLAIQATKDTSSLYLCSVEPFRSALLELGYERPEQLPLGAVVSLACLHEAYRITGPPADTREAALGNYEPSRWGWPLSDVHRLSDPIPQRGYQTVFDVTDTLVPLLDPTLLATMATWPIRPLVARAVRPKRQEYTTMTESNVQQNHAPGMPAIVGFTGPRDLDTHWRTLVQNVVAQVRKHQRRIVVGDATGLDTFVTTAARSLGHEPHIFRPHDRRTPTELAQRSAAMVETVQGGGPGSALLAFVHDACPAGLIPTNDSRKAWRGGSNGTWSTIAYAAGRGVTTMVFWCVDGPLHLPEWPGAWTAAAESGFWAQAWRYTPPVQTLLLDEADAAALVSPTLAPQRSIDDLPRRLRSRR